jgi:hypothetical protein
MKRLLPLLALIALLAALAIWLLRPGPAADPPAAPRKVATRPAAPPAHGPRATPPSQATAAPSHASQRAAEHDPLADPGDAEHDPTQEDEPRVWPLDPRGIKSALREVLPDIQRCHEQARLADPALPGRITVGFTIGAADTAAETGHMVRAEVRGSSLAQKALDDCLLKATGSLLFERPAGGSKDLLLPFDFTPEPAP